MSGYSGIPCAPHLPREIRLDISQGSAIAQFRITGTFHGFSTRNMNLLKMSLKPIADIGEFGLIERISSIVSPSLESSPKLIEGIGDDCAVYELSSRTFQVVTTDLLIEEIHFDLLTTPVQHLGSKALSVNVSDICAMNAKPCYALTSIALPPKTPVEFVETLYRGMNETALLYNMALAGGDTSSSKGGIAISVMAAGEIEKERIAYRKGAEPGDLICVTGSLGGSAAGMRVLMREKNLMLEHIRNGEHYDRNLMNNLGEYDKAISQHLLPPARVDIVAFFEKHAIVPTSMIDISDGLASDIAHICKRSGVGAQIDESRIPILPQARLIADEFQDEALNFALSGGEDYQLLFTIKPQQFEKIASHHDISVIGKITPEDEGLLLRDIYGMTIDLQTMGGYNHFRE